MEAAKDILESTGPVMGQCQYCGFMLGEDLFAVPVMEVQEVIRPQKVSSVPLSNPCINGLINLRGQIVTLINLRRLFQLPGSCSEDYMNVIVRSEDSLLALMADEICDVIDVTEDSFEETPDTLDANLKKYVGGVHKLEDRLLIVLDLNQVLKFSEY